MSDNKYKLFSKIAAVTLFVFLVAGAIFVFKTDNDKIVTKQNFETEKATMLKTLNKLRDSLSVVIAENQEYAANSNLGAKQAKISTLIDKIAVAEVGTTLKKDYSVELQDLKNQVLALRRDNAALTQMNETYKKQVETLKTQRDSTINLLKGKKGVVAAVNTPITSEVEIEKYSKISVTGLKTETFQQDRAGLMTMSDKSSRANLVKVHFNISGTKASGSMFKEYYIQIIDAEENVLGLRKTKKFGKSELTYSATYPLTFKNQAVDAVTTIDMPGSTKGTYRVNIYDKDMLMSKSTFVLK